MLFIFTLIQKQIKGGKEMSDNKSTQQASNNGELKTNVLGRKDLMSIAIGQIIGAGVFALTGVVIGITGRSVNIAFMVAAFITILNAIPSIMVGGTVRLKGGTYTQAALLLGEKYAGFYMITYIISNMSIAMYAISFANYVASLWPALAGAGMIISIVVLTTFYVLNIYGIQGAAWVQNGMVALMAAALALFIVFGTPRIQPGYFQQPDFLTNGMGQFVYGVALLAYATGGATVVVNYGAEAKNPTKDIPFVIIVSTLGVAAVYGFMATIAAGVLPIAVTANQPLTWVAKEVLPSGLMYFFILCGAGFALTTTLNASLSWVTKPLLQATKDGWFPAALGKVNKHGTPIVWLTIMYIVGLITIFSGWDIGKIANFALLIGYVIAIMTAYSITRLPKVVPNAWNKARVHTTNGLLWLAAGVGMAASLFQVVVLGLNQSKEQLIGNVIIFSVAALYAQLRHKHVKMNVSYEED